MIDDKIPEAEATVFREFYFLSDLYKIYKKSQ